MDSAVTDEEKLERLYIEVRYARTTSQTLPTTASVFRLRLKGTYLKPIEYARNLQVKENTTMEEQSTEDSTSSGDKKSRKITVQ